LRLGLAGALLILAGAALAELPREMHAVEVAEVLDGDTLRLAGGTRVRLLGVDTPELASEYGPAERFAAEAAAYVKARIGSRPVRLSYEGRRLDDYGRILAHVWLEDGALLERELLSLGYAKVYRRQRFSHKHEFLRLQSQARKAGLGLWGKNS
jgi:micrococcal nuclease